MIVVLAIIALYLIGLTVGVKYIEDQYWRHRSTSTLKVMLPALTWFEGKSILVPPGIHRRISGLLGDYHTINANYEKAVAYYQHCLDIEHLGVLKTWAPPFDQHFNSARTPFAKGYQKHREKMVVGPPVDDSAYRLATVKIDPTTHEENLRLWQQLPLKENLNVRDRVYVKGEWQEVLVDHSELVAALNNLKFPIVFDDIQNDQRWLQIDHYIFLMLAQARQHFANKEYQEAEQAMRRFEALVNNFKVNPYVGNDLYILSLGGILHELYRVGSNKDWLKLSQPKLFAQFYYDGYAQDCITVEYWRVKEILPELASSEAVLRQLEEALFGRFLKSLKAREAFGGASYSYFSHEEQAASFIFDNRKYFYSRHQKKQSEGEKFAAQLDQFLVDQHIDILFRSAEYWFGAEWKSLIEADSVYLK